MVLKDESERIVCKNTLDLRAEMAFSQTLPEIRRILFDENARAKRAFQTRQLEHEKH